MVRTLKLLAIVSMMTLLPSHLHAGDVDLLSIFHAISVPGTKSQDLTIRLKEE